MALKSWAFIYSAPGLEETGRSTVIETAECRTLLVGFPTIDAAVRFVAKLPDDVQMLELCGGFGSVGAARVIEALPRQIPVGNVGYGPDSIAGLHAIFSS